MRDETEGRTDNRIFDWEAGDKAATDAAFTAADVTVALDVLYLSHPAPMETCGSLAYMDLVTGKLTASTSPARRRTPTARCTPSSPASPEHKIQVISPDIGGGFGNKVPIYPGTSSPSSARS